MGARERKRETDLALDRRRLLQRRGLHLRDQQHILPVISLSLSLSLSSLFSLLDLSLASLDAGRDSAFALPCSISLSACSSLASPCFRFPPYTCGGKGQCVVAPHICYHLYKPVCGCDGRTYGALSALSTTTVSLPTSWSSVVLPYPRVSVLLPGPFFSPSLPPMLCPP